MSLEPPFWSIHTHSRYSANDAMPKVSDMVDRAVLLGYPALGLTDHGTPAGSVQLYKSCRKAGIEPLPGMELYVTPDREQHIRSNDHLGVVAYSEIGYRNLVHLSNMAARNYWYKPRVDFADFAEMAESGRSKGLVVTTGCYFGAVVQTLLNRGPESAKQIIEALAGWFPRMYVELQHHGIEAQHGDLYTESDIIDELVALADEVGVPYLIAQDSHYLLPEEQPQHNALKELVAFGQDPSESRFPGDPYAMVDNDWLRPRFDPVVFGRALDNLAELAAASYCRIPELEAFSMKVPDVTKTGDAYAELEALITDLVVQRYGVLAKHKPYLAAVSEELSIIKDAGMAGYLLLVKLVCDFMLKEDIWFITRGSASGSLVCYLLGITQVDPIAWGLRFDRFLSRDRTRPPDIDLDVEGKRRDEVVAWLETQFSVRQVGSHAQMKMEEEQEEDSGAGALLVKYYGTFFKKHGYRIGWDKVPETDRVLLRDLATRKLISGPGTHAAGYIVAPDEVSIAELPLNWIASRGAMVTAYGKKDVEACGFVKLDLLGSDTLTAMKLACSEISRNGGITEGEPVGMWGTPKEVFDSIPLTGKEVFQRIGQGRTDGMFQIQGMASKYGFKDMKPKRLEDIVAGQALFRPAMLQGGHVKEYMARKTGKNPVPARHPDIMAETKETYGIALYQEQVIALMRRIGMESEELTDMLDAVKASNEASIAAKAYLETARSRVRELATARGWSDTDVAWLVDSLVGYAEYSFNKAHSVAYGLAAFRSAWLAEHYPLEFWLGVLVAYQGKKRGKRDLESVYVSATRNEKIRVLSPHINLSAQSYTVDRKRGSLRKGLTSVKGVGLVVATLLAENAPYSSLTDMGRRLPTKVGGAKNLALRKPPEECGGAIAALHDIGGLDGLDHEPAVTT